MVTSTGSMYSVTPDPIPAETPRNKVNPHFRVESSDENADGSVDMLINMDYASMVHYARIGLMKVLSDAAEKAIKDHGQV